MHSSVRAGDSGRPGKSSSKTAWLKPARMRTVPGGTGRPQAQCGGRLPPPAAGRAGAAPASWGLRASGDPRPAERGAGQNPSGLGRRRLALRGQQRRHPRSPRGLQGQPKCTLRSPPLSRPFSGRSGRAGLGVSCGLGAQPWSGSVEWLPDLPPYLAQNDPHGGVCLDGEAQCFQGAEGRVHLALCHTLVEGA